MRGFREIADASELSLGELVFKGRQPGEEGYALPSKYKSGGDLTDYYHVGVVTSLSPFEITHCTSVQGGIKRDGKIGKWRYAGMLKQVNTEREMEKNMLYKAKVVSENGKSVNLRADATRSAKLLKTVAPGKIVEVLEEADDDWAGVRYGTTEGYMMRKFLEREGSGGQAEYDEDELYDRLMRAQQLITEAIEIIGGAAG